MQPPAFLNRRLRIIGQIRRNFDADKAILAATCLIDRGQHISRGLNISHRDHLKDLPGRLVTLTKFLEILFVGITLGNRLLKNGGIRGNTA